MADIQNCSEELSQCGVTLKWENESEQGLLLFHVLFFYILLSCDYYVLLSFISITGSEASEVILSLLHSEIL